MKPVSGRPPGCPHLPGGRESQPGRRRPLCHLPGSEIALFKGTAPYIYIHIHTYVHSSSKRPNTYNCSNRCLTWPAGWAPWSICPHCPAPSPPPARDCRLGNGAGAEFESRNCLQRAQRWLARRSCWRAGSEPCALLRRYVWNYTYILYTYIYT